MLSGELGVSQACPTCSYIVGVYMNFSEVAVFYYCGQIYVQNSILSLSGGESVSPSEVMLQVAGMCRTRAMNSTLTTA